MLSILDSKWILFVKVTELGSLTHAAAALNVPQSVISRQIATLERECGARLFRRTGRGVVLTDFGEQIFPRVKALIAQADQLSDDIHTSSGEPLGEVRLGLLPSVVPAFCGPIYRAVARFPKIRLHLTEGSSVQLEDWLNQGRLDLSLLLREDDLEQPGELTLSRLSLSLIGPLDDALTSQPTVQFDQLGGLPLVLPGEPHLLRARLTTLASQRGVKLNVVMEADSITLQQEIVIAGGGYAIVASAAIATGLPRRFSAALITNPALPRRVILSTTLLRPHTLATRAVSTLVQELGKTIL